MFQLRTGIVALALLFAAGLENQSEAATYIVRVEVRSLYTGNQYQFTLFASTNRQLAANEYAYYELLMKVYPQKFANDVLDDDLGLPWYYVPVRLHFDTQNGIYVTGRR